MIHTTNDRLDFLDNSGSGAAPKGSNAGLIQDLLYEIIRVKELIKYYEAIPNGAGSLGASILSELVAEAYKSLVDYDTVLMQKYYDLLLHCD
jgi:hypothetical protein